MDETAAVAASAALVLAAGCAAEKPALAPARTPAAVSGPAASSAPAQSEQPPSAEDVRHLLDRLTFGARLGDASRVRALGIERWLERELLAEGPDGGAETAVLPFLPALNPALEVVRHFAGDYRQDTSGFDGVELLGKRHRVDVRRLLDYAQMAQIARQVSADHQLKEVMVEFWTNHFNVYARKGKVKLLAGNYVEAAIRPHALGRFEDLLLATARHPAMLFYLDNVMSVRPLEDAADSKPGARGKRRRGLNENYARELLELHTVGARAGYGQSDVIDVARILTGWGVQRKRRGQKLEFEFHQPSHDQGEKVVLGMRFSPGQGLEEGLNLLRFLARHPATARRIADKICRRFIADDPPERAVDELAGVFEQSRGDIKAVLHALVRSADFWDQRARRAKLKTPGEFLASALRALGASAGTTTELVKVSAGLGAPPLMQPVPTGYSDDAKAWVGGSQLLSRMQLAVKLASGELPGVRLDLSSVFPATAEPAELLERLNQVVFGGLARPATLRVISERIRGLSTAEDQRTVGLALALGSPEFQYQ